MILKRIKTLPPKGRENEFTRHIYRSDRGFILGIYSISTAKFYDCDKNGKKLHEKTLNFIGNL